MKIRTCIALALLACALVLLTVPADAIPAFARKYDTHCTMCHVAYPRLNDFGERYRDNGYQMPSKESDEVPVEKAPVPVSFRTTVGYFRHTEHNPGGAVADGKTFVLDGLDILAGGVVRPNIGFFATYLPQINGSRGVAQQDSTLEQGNLVFVMHKPSWMGNVRVGRFEPDYTPISALRALTMAPYEVLDFPGVENLPLSETQTGIEFVARLHDAWRLSTGLVNGSDSLNDDDSPDTYYLRAARMFKGEGASSGYRFGAEYINGKSRAPLLALSQLALVQPEKKGWSRWGLNTSMVFKQTTVLAQYVHGNADKELNFFDPARDYKWHGWFIEADQMIKPMLVGFLRFDSVKTPSEQDQDIDRWTIGGRWYLEHNLALHGEYSRQTIKHGADNGGSFRANDLSLALDLAF